ncbi:MAG: hypothetical protein ACHQRM_17795 [Bacteroidia bacterium]
MPIFVLQQKGCATRSGTAIKAEPVKEFQVSGLITQTQSYCGGARPPEDLLKRLQSPHPLSGKKIYFRKGTKNTLDMQGLKDAVSDSTGHFKVMLTSGSYCIIEEDQVKALDVESFKKKYLTPYLVADEVCLKQWWDKCYSSFELGAADKSDVNLNFHMPCFTKGLPCVKYTGPMPQ